MMKNRVQSAIPVFTGIAFFIVVAVVCKAGPGGPGAPGIKVEAPMLGITASSVLLIWNDQFSADRPSVDPASPLKEYWVYQDNVKIGSTRNRTFTAQGLSAAKSYRFSIRLADAAQDPPSGENSIAVTTKRIGRIVDVRDFAARGDGSTADGEAIQKAIDRCPKGGIVRIPAGKYRVGHLALKSELTLLLVKAAILSFEGYRAGTSYPVTKAILPGPDGDIRYEAPSLITGVNVHHVTITGEGTIDAGGATWWPHYKEVTRPFTIEFIQSSNILVQGITMQDPPFWNNHLVYVDSAIYSGVQFLKVSKAAGVNGDGLDPDASRNILIVGCLFANQDDCIAIKSGRYDTDGNRRRRSSEYITIRECRFDATAAPGAGPLGIGVGSECSGGIKHVLIQNCLFTEVASLVNIKANRQRAFGFVDDIRVEHNFYTNHTAVDRWWNRAPVSIDLFYGAPAGSNPSVPASLSPQTPVFRNIHFNDITIDNPAGKGIYISGLAESPVHDISFDKVVVRSRDGITVQHVDTLSINGITVISLTSRISINLHNDKQGSQSSAYGYSRKPAVAIFADRSAQADGVVREL
jgi:exo-poly-alpha-galacturonosidase